METGNRKYTNFIILLVSVSFLIAVASAQDCLLTEWSHNDIPCPRGYSEIYKNVDRKDRKSVRWCCIRGTDSDLASRRSAPNCRATKCLSSTTADICSTLAERYIEGRKLEYEEVLRDPCTREGGAGKGVVGLCCQPNSNEALLVSILGAEDNEFPHQAKLKLPGHCGGTVYNKKFIVTAAHCLVDKSGNVKNVSNMEVILGTNIADANTKDYIYKVKRAIPHEKYSKLAGQPELTKKDYSRTFNDIGLLELDREVRFGENIKALEIAPKGFDPFKYADTTVNIGWGTTDTLALAIHLQKANFVMRKDQKCFGVPNGKWRPFHGMENQLLCLGGVLESKWSYTAGGGDSGGPAVCRNENGHPVLCGVTSFGGSDEKCVKNSVESNCPPSVYAEVAYFHDWIVSHAGPQDRKTLYQPYLYGKNVPKGQYEHQVRITSKTGKNCGGTLISPDVVITAAQCVVSGDGSRNHAELKVTTGINDQRKDKGQTFGVKDVVRLPGFKMDGPPVNVRLQGDRVLIRDNYHTNDLAILKLSGKASLSPSKFPDLPTPGETFVRGEEISFLRNTSRSGQLMSREFKLLGLDDCQTRMDRMSKAKLDVKVEKNVLCGVETYSAGSTCDRELGGGLICKGRGGKDVLCGVQIFRLCEFSVPNGFINMGLYSNWVKDEMKRLLTVDC